MKQVYLAGPIGGTSYALCTDWREKAKDALAEVGIAGFSPMRAKNYLSNVERFSSVPNAYGANPLSTSKGIMARDYNDCTKADALLVNFEGASKVSIGTVMEIAWAYQSRIPVVVVAPAEDVHLVHPMMHEAVPFRVDTLDEGVQLIKTILLPE